MIDHVALYVTGYGVVMEMEGFVAIGSEGHPRLGLRTGKDASTTAHVAFQTDDRAAVDAFHTAAMGAGGVEEGVPGVREHYHPTYYAAYVHDPDGNNVEVVCHNAA